MSRAKWTKFEELDLLSEYFDARRSPSLATDKGIKSKAWAALTTKLNAKKKLQLDKSQYKSKLDRLMRDYDLYKDITSLSGCGICPDTSKPLVDDDVWDKLIESRPKQRSKIKEFRKQGFEYKTDCSLISGDSRATGESADSIATFVSHLNRTAPDEEAGSAGESDTPQDTAVASPIPDTAKAAKLPPSHQEQLEKVKRIRDGASKEKRSSKKSRGGASSSGFELKLEEFLATAQAYLKVKTASAKLAAGCYPQDEEQQDNLVDDDEEEDLREACV